MVTPESLRDFKPQRPAALLLACLMVLSVELVVRCIPEKHLFNFSSRLGFAHFIATDVLPKFKQPQVVIFGTSRAADAIMPTRLDTELGLPPNSTANISMFASHTSDWEALYRDNRAKLSGAKLVVCALDVWSFSTGYANDEHFCMVAPLTDRIHYIDGVELPECTNETPEAKSRRESEHHEHLITRRNVLIADGLFSMRLKLQYVPAALFRVLHLGDIRRPRFDQNNMIRTNKGDIVGKLDDYEKYENRLAFEFGKFDTQPTYVRHIESLARMAQEDGARFVLLQLPNRRRYQDLVAKRFPECYAQHKRVVENLAGRLGVTLLFVDYPEEIGLTDTDYEDYGHMVTSGANGATDWLGNEIKRHGWLKN